MPLFTPMPASPFRAPLRSLATLLVLGVAAGHAFAATNSTPAESPSRPLESIVEEALAGNPELRFYEAEIAAATAGRRSSAAWRNPEISGTVGHKTADAGGFGTEGIAWSVSVLQPFEWPGRLGLRKAIANHDVQLAELGLARFRAALAGRVRALAYGLFAAQEKSAAAGEVAERFRALREVLIQRDPAGLTPLLEIRVIEATELNAQRRASDALLTTESALLELNQLRGAPPQAALRVADGALAFPPARDRDALLAMARTNNFELKLRATELAQQGFRVDLARNERYPAIALGPTFSEENAGTDRERILGLVVSLPLPAWNRNRGEIEAASARRTQASVSYELAQRDVTRRVLEAALTYETKLREMARWRPDSTAHFREAAELADRHYRLGAVPISTYVELQKQYLEAVEGLLDTKREALVAAVQLEVLTGSPLPLTHANPTPEAR